jgi:hypothetical protein
VFIRYVFESQSTRPTIGGSNEATPMAMDKTLYYLFDPLCGWCYGATPAVAGLLAIPGVSVELLPTGLFLF